VASSCSDSTGCGRKGKKGKEELSKRPEHSEEISILVQIGKRREVWKGDKDGRFSFAQAFKRAKMTLSAAHKGSGRGQCRLIPIEAMKRKKEKKLASRRHSRNFKSFSLQNRERGEKEKRCKKGGEIETRLGDPWCRCRGGEDFAVKEGSRGGKEN